LPDAAGCLRQFCLYIWRSCFAITPALAHFQAFEKGDNLFPTTIAMLASAVQKLARVARISESTVLYSGRSRLMELPPDFFRPDKQGRRFFAEGGFLSTTQSKEIALTYSGVRDSQGGDGRRIPMVMEHE
jgi:hypothetical protein